MERMKFETPDMVAGNVEKIGAMFPNCVTEALDEERSTPDKPVYKKAINFELLRQMLSKDVVEGDEAYEFTWVGKKAAIVEANKPIRATLRPCPEESVNWDTTENLYIEGDNLQVLKLLQESYLGKVKMIYIDPPYNTGNDFIYRDDFAADSEEYKQEQGLYDEENNKLFRNTDTNGRFHSDWCSMIYSRLALARNLLSDEGIIFISIDENEVETLTKICDEVFGIENHVGTIVVKSNPRGSMSTSEIASLHEYLVLYTKKRICASIIGHELSDEMASEYRYTDDKGAYRLLGLRMRGGFWRRSERPNLYYPIYINPESGEVSVSKSDLFSEVAVPVQPSTMEDGTWRWSKERVSTDSKSLIASRVNRHGEMVWDVFQKDYLNRTEGRRTKAKSIWDEAEINYQNGTTEIKELFGSSAYFDYPKPVFLIQQAIRMIKWNENDIVMDFFSGSGTTAHAVLRQNADDRIARRFVLVQLNERINERSEAYKAGYKTICDIGKERIRRAGRKIREENPLTTQDLDIGFRVLKLDSTNMKDVYYNPADITQTGLLDMVSNIKEDRNDLDLLFGCLIDWGLPLSLSYTSEQIDGCTVHTYNDGDLIACFDADIPDSVIRTIAKRKPLRAVFRDASFSDSPAKINVFEIFKLLAPDTSVKVI